MADPDDSFDEPRDMDLDETIHDESSSGSRWRVLLPVAVLLLATGGAAALFNARETPTRTERKSLGPLVESLDVEAADVPVRVAGHGEVSARIEVELLSEVPGKVTWVSSDLRSGGRFDAGEVLLRIDDRDYSLAVERARAAVARARTSLEREQAEADAALAEWRELHGDDAPPDLLVRGPQIRQAQAELAAAQADESTAELNLSRTRLSLPFNGVVVSETVSPGQFVASGRAIASVYGTDAVEVRVPLADSELAWFDVAARPEAVVRAQVAGADWTWRGTVERLEGRVDPRSRMVHVVVTIDDPFVSPKDRSQPRRPPLLPGTFVDIDIAGRTLEDVFQLPRYALRDGGVVWTARAAEDGAESTPLRLREVEVVRSDRRHAFVRGLDSGEHVITSALDAAVDGMAVRLAPPRTSDDATPAETQAARKGGASS